MPRPRSELRPFYDTGRLRQAVLDNVVKAFQEKGPIEGRRYALHLSGVSAAKRKFTLADQKRALLNDQDLTVPVRGMAKLIDKSSGKVLDQKKLTLAHVPYITPRGTAISGGNEYALVNQFRLKPGVYNRVRANGELESHFNTTPGTGPSFRLGMEPESGIFKFEMGNSKRKLYPLLQAAGVDDDTLKRQWGPEVLQANRSAKDPRALNTIYQKVFRNAPDKGLSDQEKAREIFTRLGEGQLDPAVTKTTLGTAHRQIGPMAMLDASRRILNINRGTETPDDRDSLQFRTLHGPEDFFAEKIRKDAGGVQRLLMYKLEQDPSRSLKKLQAGYFTPQVRSLLHGDARALPLEELNPLDLLEQQTRVIALGEGGIPSIRSVPDEARNVHGSQFGIIDPIRGPESDKIGVDTRLAFNTFKGPDRQPYGRFLDNKSGKPVFLKPEEMTDTPIAFPGQWQKKGRRISVMHKGKMKKMDRNKVPLRLDEAQGMFALTSNLVPMTNSTSGGRLLMAGKAFSSTLPLHVREAPLVRAKVPGKDQSFDNLLGRMIGSHEAKAGGKVTKITKDEIHVRSGGKTVKHQRYNMFPFNRQTFIDSKPVVAVGQAVKKGDVLASTNFTTDKGTLAIGRNLRVAYSPFKGFGADDGIVISEGAAKKLTSEHMFTKDLQKDKQTVTGRDRFLSNFPTLFNRGQVSQVDKDGVAKPGTRLAPGDPIVLSLRQKSLSTHDVALGKLHKSLRNTYTDNSLTWDGEDDAEVVDVVKTKKGFKVNVVTRSPARVADKLSGRYGNKGVISAIIPDDQMPTGEDGRSVEIMLNPLGVPSRLNPAQVYEAVLGKVAKKTGEPVMVENFAHDDYLKYTKALLKKHGLSDTETLTDPMTGKKIPKVMTGYSHILKIGHTAKKGFSARDVGPAYTAELLPAKGGKEGAKRIGGMIVNALVAHGAKENLKEMFTIKGQRNDAFWRAMRLGYPLPTPKAPFIMEKFKNSLMAGGINVQKQGSFDKLLPMTDSETSRLSGGEIQNARMFRRNDLQPEKGGLFDFGVTGGPRGERWSHISLSQPIPNPVMEEPIRRMLGLTQKKMRSVLGHQEQLEGKTGGKALQQALGKLNLVKEMARHKAFISSGRKTGRDNAIKTLGYLKNLKTNGLEPADLMISKVPVIPPVFRPVTFIGDESSVISAANQLYADTMHMTSAVKSLQKDLPGEAMGSEYLGEYDAVKATMGLGDPVSPKARAKGLKGFIRQITGSQPKHGMFQRKVVSRPQDLSGRAVVVPDPTLGMDEVGLPKEMAWKVFRPFMIRDMVRKGMKAVQANQEIENRSPRAQQSLMKVMQDRPVLINRAPTLHKFNIMAVKPKLRNDKSLAVSSLIASGFNLDHDGDQMNVYVPVTEEARREALEKMLPSKNLFALRGKWPIHTPVQDAVLGLYQASNVSGKKVQKFASKEAAIAAYRAGKIAINDPIEIPDA